MASTIQIKNSTTSGNSPSSLATGELAINVVDGNFFYGSASAVKQDFALGNLTASNTAISGTLSIEGSGSTLFEVVGSEGQLFSITDNLSGSLFAVSDVSGLPILEVFSDDTVKIGTFNNEGLIVGGTNVTASGNVDIQGILSIPGFTNVSASLAAAVASGDDLGNHTASLDLNMGGNAITNVGNVDGVDVSALNSTVSTNTSNIATLTAATSSYLTTVDISDDTNLTAGTGITLTGDTLSTNDSQIIHDNLSGFVANEHIDHSTVSITAGNGLTGGGTIASTRTLNVGAGDGISVAADSVAVDSTVLRTTGDSVLSSSAQIASDISGAFTAGGGISLSGGEFSVAAGVGLTQGATGLSFDADGGTLTTNNADVDHILINDGGTFKRITKGNINVGDFNNNVGYLTSSPFTAAGISGSFTLVSASLAADIPTNNNQLINGAGYTTNTGTVTSVGGTGTVSGLSLSGTVTTSGNLTLGGTISISSTNITDVDAFSQTGTYASLRAQGTTAGDVGLGNVTNESKATMFTSPTFTGTTAAPTPSTSDDSTKIATTAYVQANLDNLIGNAGAALDTLGELSASLADATGSIESLVTEIDGKLAKASNLSDLTNAATARTNLGVDPAGTDNSTNVTLTGTPDYITISGQTITRNQIDLTTDVTGQLPAANLGTITSAKISDVDAFSQTGTYASLRAQGTTKEDVGLGNVENTALSTYTGNGGALDNQYITNGAGYLTTVDISTDTNLVGGTNLTLSGDTMNLDSNISLTSITASGDISASGYIYGTSLVGPNEYAFRYSEDLDVGLYFNTTAVRYEFRDLGASSIFSIGATTGNTTIGGTLTIPGFSDVSASLAAAVAGGDNLGNHTATQNLDMGGYAITNVGNVDGRDVSADGSKLDGIEAGADVTDTANVTAAGALMDSEVDADIKTLSLPANTTISTFGASLIDDTTATAARTTLGLGSMATQTSTDYLNINGGTLQGDLDLGTYNVTNVGELRATTISGSTFVSDGVTVVSTPDIYTVEIGQSAGGVGGMNTSIVANGGTQYGLFSNSGIQLTGSVDISSTLSIPGFTDVSASLASLTSTNYVLSINSEFPDQDGDVLLSTSNISEGSNQYYTDARVKTKLNAENVVSGSAQIASDISGSFTSTSASIATDISNIERLSKGRITFLYTSSIDYAPPGYISFLDQVIDTIIINTSSYNGVDLDASVSNNYSSFQFNEAGSLITVRKVSDGSFKTYKVSTTNTNYTGNADNVGYVVDDGSFVTVMESGSISDGDEVEFIWDKSAGVGGAYGPTAGYLTKTFAGIYQPGYNYLDMFFGTATDTEYDGSPNNLSGVTVSSSFTTPSSYFLPAISQSESLTLGGLTVNGGITSSGIISSSGTSDNFFGGRIILDNSKYIAGTETGGTTRNILSIDGSDITQVANSNLATNIKGTNVTLDGNTTVNGTLRIGGILDVSASIAAASGGGGGSSPVFITALGGRVNITTSTDAGEDNIVLAGGLGAHYYNWNTQVFTAANAVSSGIGTPGTSTFTAGTGYNVVNGVFRVLADGDATIAGTIEFDSNAEVQGQTMRFFVWKLDSSEVSALDNGTYDSSWSGTLVASTSVTVPGSSQNIIPMRFKSTNGTSVSADDMIFATCVFDGTVTGTRYFNVNYQLYTT